MQFEQDVSKMYTYNENITKLKLTRKKMFKYAKKNFIEIQISLAQIAKIFLFFYFSSPNNNWYKNIICYFLFFFDFEIFLQQKYFLL